MSAEPAERQPRKDAVRNRALLIKAAVEAFREGGLGVSVNAIADRAGVNVATLYRHFPAKDDLIAGVIDSILEPMAVAVERALDEGAGGRELEVFVRESVRMHTEHRGLVDVLANELAAAGVKERLRQPAVEIVVPLVERAHASGELREDFDATDLLSTMRMVAAVSRSDRSEGNKARYAAVVVRGLRPG